VADDPANRIWRVAYTQADTAVRLATIKNGLARPEGMRWDPEQRIWFISNINGGPGHDNNGFITRLRGDGTIENLRFVAGGREGVTLHAPKGMVIVGDTLWVADLDAVRGFNRHGGRPVATVDLQPLGALFLNDITVGADGALYVTDTGVQFDSAGTRIHTGPDRIFRIRGRQPSVAFEGPSLAQPNGITYDRAGRRFLLAPIEGTARCSSGRAVPRCRPTWPAVRADTMGSSYWPRIAFWSRPGMTLR
jgi:sugar lactone lactonase YvrE